MKVSKEELSQLFDLLSSKTGESLNLTGFREMEFKIENGITQRYLYDKYLTVQDISSHAEVSINETLLTAIIQYVGFENYREFQHFLQNPIPEVLKHCEGTWVSYVRQNSGNGIVYQSPVRIYEESNKMIFHLKGPSMVYQGEISFNNGCLFTTFKAQNQKQFQHIYKIGNSKHPKLMQGIFSGISSSNDPIGGRTILLRSDLGFNQLKNEQLSIDQMISSEDSSLKKMGEYFKDFHQNNLRLNPSMTFDIYDL